MPHLTHPHHQFNHAFHQFSHHAAAALAGANLTSFYQQHQAFNPQAAALAAAAAAAASAASSSSSSNPLMRPADNSFHSDPSHDDDASPSGIL